MSENEKTLIQDDLSSEQVPSDDRFLRWQRVKNIFEAANVLVGAERERFLNDKCDEDTQLRHEVEKLLKSFDEADTSFLEEPAVKNVADMFEERPSTGELQNVDFVAGTLLANRYRIIGLLGKGGMGEVYRAEDMKLDQTVALKFLPDKLAKNEDALKRFIGEVRNARQVSHANVCRVFDLGETEGRHFISMEFVEGDDLSSLLRRIGRLPSDKAVEISRQLCFGLAAIHEAGILHRDLKPANIIIDARGKARITDFGIAGIEEEITGGEIRVGTPAYMSPEQIIGKEVSQRSDIYSLGLLLYEIFTGKPAFEFESVRDLLQNRATATPTNPSEILRDIDPIVERTILYCIENESSKRPKSALQVAMLLPGGNPLDAAIAAGETPSPEMVAAAPKQGALRPKVAVSCLAAIVGLLTITILLSGRVKQHEWIPFEKSPEVLAAQAGSIINNLGYSDAALDTDYGFAGTTDYVDYAEKTDPAPERWEKMRSGQPVAIYFWYRQSPRYLVPLARVNLSPDDPANDISGMKKLILDPLGRLIEFEAVPAQVEEKLPQTESFGWSIAFAQAGLNIKNFRKAESLWTPPVYSDERAAWEGEHVDHPEIPVRVEGAAYQGKPVYFQVVAPWDKPSRQEETFVTAQVKAAGVILTSVFLIVLVAGIFLARYNLRVGRGDKKGAFKLALFVLVVSIAANFLVASHVPDLIGELFIFFKTINFSLFNAALVWLVYIALEPYARRRWPALIISWNRLLAGEFRDPLVGRDVLVGILLGLCHTGSIYLMTLLPRLIYPDVPPNPGANTAALEGFRNFFALFLLSTVNAIFNALAPLFFLILLIVILRKERLAIAAFWLINFAILGLAFASAGPWLFWIGPALIATITIVCLARFGLLATILFFVAFFLSFHNTISSKVSAFYFSNTVFAVVIILGLAVYGFYTSLAGQPIFGTRLMKEIEDQ